MEKSRRRWIPVVASMAVLVLFAAVGIAQADHVTVSNTCSPTGAQADGTTVNTVNTNVGPTKLRTKEAVEIVNVCSTGAPLFTSHWHHHAGPVLVNVMTGTLTFYTQANCDGVEVGPGQAYLESTGVPLVARNESTTVTATWITTQIIPEDAPLSTLETTTFCGVT